jgi:hypothetical protein
VDALCGYPQIGYVPTTLAPADVFAQVLVADDNELSAFLQEKVRPLPGVLDTQVHLEIEVHKLWFDSPGPGLARGSNRQRTDAPRPPAPRRPRRPRRPKTQASVR